MAFSIRKIDYFYATIQADPVDGYRLLSHLAESGINLLAFTAVPVGPLRTQLSLFPEDAHKLLESARRIGLDLDGPHSALLAQGDDELGALAEIHEKLAGAGVSVYASSGVTDGKGSYGYVVYVRPEDVDRAAAALGV